MSTYVLVVLAAVVLPVIKHLFFWSAAEHGEHYFKKPVFFAHRGLLHMAPENSRSAFQAAIDKGFNAVEYDIVGTMDGEIVCSHNFDLERKTDGKGWIADLNWDKVRRIKTGPADRRVPITRFEEALCLFPDNILQNIEVKTSNIFDIRTALKAVYLIKKHRKEKNVIISSFNPFTILAVRIKAPEIRTGFILETMDYFNMINWVHPDFLHPAIEILSDNLIKFARDRNMGLNVWTVNNKKAIQYLLDRRIDGVITDRHELHPDNEEYGFSAYEPEIKNIPLHEIRKIRHEVLRQGLKYNTTLWNRDKDKNTIHFGLVKNNEIVSIVTYFNNDTEYLPGKQAIQLRGMATRPKYQGHGYGSVLLTRTLKKVKKMERGDVVWANIRKNAIDFYKRHGFKFISDEFEVPGIGPHRVGVYELY